MMGDLVCNVWNEFCCKLKKWINAIVEPYCYACAIATSSNSNVAAVQISRFRIPHYRQKTHVSILFLHLLAFSMTETVQSFA